MDDEILQEFWVDTQSHIDAVEESLLHLDKDGSRADLIDDIFRRVHSLKGNAGVLGLMEIYEYGQEFESFLEGTRERRQASRDEVDHMFEGLDRIKTLVYSAKGEAPPAVHGDDPQAADMPPVAPAPAAQAQSAPAQAAPVQAAPVQAVPAKAAPAKAADKTAPQPVAPASVASLTGSALQAAKASAATDASVTFLVFTVADERYGVEIMKVREIILMEPITPVPNTLGFVIGVMNLRDQVIPVFDLKKKLNVTGDVVGNGRNIIVVEIDKVVTGLQVDDVNGIMAIPVGRIEPPDLFEGTIETDYLYGLGNTENGAIILLDTTVLCAPSEVLF